VPVHKVAQDPLQNLRFCALIKEDKKRTQMTTTTTLTQDVAEHWQKCLEVNSSWRQFSHELAVLNTLDMLTIEDCEFVADLLLDTDEFEDEDFAELLFACFEFASEREVDVDLISAHDLWTVVESGATVIEVAEAATEAGVSISVINDFAEV
jgi:sugar phosphate isomerase/epimerase